MGVLLMLLSIGGLAVAGIVLVVSLLAKKAWLVKFTLAGVAVWFASYAVMLVGFSFASSDQTLALSEAKAYCGFYLDCHMHTAVTGVRTAKMIGDRRAKGIFYILNVKVFSDAKNPNVALRLLEPTARILRPADEHFDRDIYIDRDIQAEALLPTAAVTLDTDIHNYQTIDKEIVFDIDHPTPDTKLLITEGYGIDKYIEAVLIDDEDSILHKKNYFDLREQIATADVK